MGLLSRSRSCLQWQFRLQETGDIRCAYAFVVACKFRRSVQQLIAFLHKCSWQPECRLCDRRAIVVFTIRSVCRIVCFGPRGIACVVSIAQVSGVTVCGHAGPSGSCKRYIRFSPKRRRNTREQSPPKQKGSSVALSFDQSCASVLVIEYPAADAEL